MATGLVGTNQQVCMVVAAADRQPPWRSRVSGDGSSFMSDGAAACAISLDPRGFRILGIVSHSHVPLLTLGERSNYLGYLAELYEQLSRFAQLVEMRAGVTIRSLKYVITDNFSSQFLALFRDGLGLRREQCVTPAKRFGHIFSADTLWSLHELHQAGTFKPHDTVALLNIGVCTWSVVVLEKV